MLPVLCISIGDFNGIGPEVILKSLNNSELTQKSRIVILGHHSIIDFYADSCGMRLNYLSVSDLDDLPNAPGIYSLDIISTTPEINPGKIESEAGLLSMKAVEAGALACINQKAHALITAPISKEAIQLAGYKYAGHTEFLANLCNTDDFVMMLVNNQPLRVALVTIHVPVSVVANLISQGRILKTIRLVYESLTKDYRVTKPKIAVLGLNPHAGDGGVIGRDEIEIISPAIKKANDVGHTCEGPFPADGFFASQSWKKYDAVVAMYHDQGLIPFKTLSFNEGVNVTTGLPIIRTSPDHGTAFAIAAKNKADSGSFTEALQLAYQFATNRFHGG